MKKTILAFSLFSILVGLSLFGMPQKTEASTIRHNRHTTSTPYSASYSNYGYGSGYYNSTDYATYPTFTSPYAQNSTTAYGYNPYNSYGNNGSSGTNLNITNNYTTNNYYYGYGTQYAYPTSNVYAPTQYTSGSPSGVGYSGTTCTSTGYCY